MKFMKKILLAVLAFLMLMTTACGGEVDVIEAAKNYKHDKKLDASVPDHFTERPVYALPENATEDEARQMIIKAMEDQISFPWTPEQTFSYTKVVGTDKQYIYFSGNGYAGLPYSSAASSMFHALEYYDYSTGVLHGFDWKQIGSYFGNSCAAAVNWAVCAVCPRVNAVSSSQLTSSFGYVPVGDIKLPNGLVEFSGGQNATNKLVWATGEEAMMEIYASVKPGDVIAKVGSEDDGHVMMVHKDPVVVRNEDGSINKSASKVFIIDQWSSQRDMKIGDNSYKTCGRIDREYTFEKYYTEGYMAFRAKFLANYQGYEKAYVKTNKEVKALKDLGSAKMETNFRVIKYEGALISESGNTVYLNKVLTNRNLYISGSDRSCSLSKVSPDEAEMKKVMKKDTKYTYEVRILVSTGEELTVCQIPVTLDDMK